MGAGIYIILNSMDHGMLMQLLTTAIWCFRPKIVQLSLEQDRDDASSSRRPAPRLTRPRGPGGMWVEPCRATQTLPGHPHTNPPSISPKTPNAQSLFMILIFYPPTFPMFSIVLIIYLRKFHIW